MYRIGAIRQSPAAAFRGTPPVQETVVGLISRSHFFPQPLPPQCWCHGEDRALRPSFSLELFASTWDGSFIYAAPHITSLARLFVSRLNPVIAATAGGRMEALSPSPLENGPLPPINSTSQRISVNQASGPHRPANSVGFLDSDLAKTPREWLARNTAVFV